MTCNSLIRKMVNPPIIAVLLFYSSTTNANTFSIDASKDATLVNASPDLNNGFGPSLDIKPENNISRTLVAFDLQKFIDAGVDESHIESAVIEFDISLNFGWPKNGSPNLFSVSAHNLTSSWDESEVTWNCSTLNCGTSWNGGEFLTEVTDKAEVATFSKGKVVLASSKIRFDVKSDIISYLNGSQNNFGWIIKKTSENSSGVIQFESKESNIGPKLFVKLNTSIDLFPPTITIVDPKRQIYIGNIPQPIKISFQDDVQGVNTESLKVLLDGQNITDSCATNSLSLSTCNLPTNLRNGEHLITASIADYTGKQSSVKSTFTYYVDQTTAFSHWIDGSDKVTTNVNVGIGTEFPTETLDVHGNAAISGSVSTNNLSAFNVNTDSMTVNDKLVANNEFEAHTINATQSITTKIISATDSVETASLNTEIGHITGSISGKDANQITNVKYVKEEIAGVLPELLDDNYVIKWDNSNNKLRRSRILDTDLGTGIGLPLFSFPTASLEVGGDTKINGALEVTHHISLANTPSKSELNHGTNVNFVNQQLDALVNTSDNVIAKWDASSESFIDSNIVESPTTGFIGIGVLNPQAKLDLLGNAKITGSLHIQGDSQLSGNSHISGNLSVAKNIRVSTTDGQNKQHATNVEFVEGQIETVNNAMSGLQNQINELPGIATEKPSYIPKWDGDNLIDSNMVQTSVGVGIGTATPRNALDVVGNANVTGILEVDSINADGAITINTINSANELHATNVGFVKAQIDSLPDINTQKVNHLAKSDGSNLIDSNIIETDVGVGIDVLSPQAKLEVGGNAKIHGQLAVTDTITVKMPKVVEDIVDENVTNVGYVRDKIDSVKNDVNASFNNVTGEINALQTDIANVDEKLGTAIVNFSEDISTANQAIDSAVTSLSSNITNIDSKIDNSVEEFNNGIESTNLALNNAVDGINSTINTVNTELTNTNTKFDNAVSNLNSSITDTKTVIENSVSSLNGKLDSSVTQLNNKISATNTTLNNAVSTINVDLEKVESELSSAITSINGEISAIDTALTTTAEEINSNIGRIDQELDQLPGVASIQINAVSKWNGSELVDSSISDTTTGVGIGTNSPSAKLDVKGDARISGGLTITMPANPGNGNAVNVGHLNQKIENLQTQIDGIEPENPNNELIASVSYEAASQKLSITEGGASHSIVLEGLEGPQGEIGPQGIQGIKGDKGNKGDTGAVGPRGLQGPKGDTGPQGIQGIKGDKGNKGDTGGVGPRGLQGPKGDTGPQGIQGIKGDKGNKGDTGAVGPRGPQGPKGDTGPQGIQGIKGDKGNKGDTGAVGPRGLQGPQGIQGIKGDKGNKGDTGAVGPRGLQGDKGAKGDPGPFGKICGAYTLNHSGNDNSSKQIKLIRSASSICFLTKVGGYFESGGSKSYAQLYRSSGYWYLKAYQGSDGSDAVNAQAMCMTMASTCD